MEFLRQICWSSNLLGPWPQQCVLWVLVSSQSSAHVCLQLNTCDGGVACFVFQVRLPRITNAARPRTRYSGTAFEPPDHCHCKRRVLLVASQVLPRSSVKLGEVDGVDK